MASQPYSIRFDLQRSPTLYAWLTITNLVLAATTALFIAAWARLETLEPATRWFVRYILVHGHLATENVLAAWYSSLLLLGVAIAGVVGFVVDGRQGRSALRYGWLLLAAVFALLSLDEIGSLHERLGMLPWLSGSGLRPTGWVYVLALPIAAVSLFLLGFSCLHLRRVPRAAVLLASGVLCFALNPVVEAAEMSLLKHQAGTWGRFRHDVLLVFEEGGLELFGMLLFGAGVLTYLGRVAGPSLELRVRRRLAHAGWGVIAVGLAIGAAAAPNLVARLPEGDTGLAQNWFPAAAWFLTGAAALGLSRLRWMFGFALLISAGFGAGLFGYLPLTPSAPWQLPLIGVVAAWGALELVLWRYRLSFSPRSSIASPTLRRPRPNPS